jgi:hypothetical protein
MQYHGTLISGVHTQSAPVSIARHGDSDGACGVRPNAGFCDMQNNAEQMQLEMGVFVLVLLLLLLCTNLPLYSLSLVVCIL